LVVVMKNNRLQKNMAKKEKKELKVSNPLALMN
jgi:hypothetical protein